MLAGPSGIRHFRETVLALILALSSPLVLRAVDAPETPGNPKAGRDLFVKKGCMRCHSVWKTGRKRGPALASVGMGRNLFELCAAIWSHWPKMNAARTEDKIEATILTAGQFRDIVAYLYYLNYYSEPGDSKHGKDIFLAKGCIQCHALTPLQDQGKPGRPVYEMRGFRGATPLAVALWTHGPEMTGALKTQRAPWPEFRDQEVVDVVEFIRSHSSSTGSREMTIPGDPLRGRTVFSAKGCAGCHGSISPVAGAPDFGAAGGGLSLSSLVARLWNHYPRMAQAMAEHGVPYPRIERSDVEDLFAYIYWLKAFGLNGDATDGHRLFREKGCASCHDDGSAEPTTPKLVGSSTASSVYSLMAGAWNHGPRMELLLKERNLSWPELTGEEMRNLVAFLRKGTSTR